ncbi:MAG: hypothetical protein ACK5OU_16750, partial [Dolichospermum sp.]
NRKRFLGRASSLRDATANAIAPFPHPQKRTACSSASSLRDALAFAIASPYPPKSDTFGKLTLTL